MNEQVKIIADTARNSISSFCINSCNAKCCKKGALLLQTDSEVNVIVGSKKDEFLKNGALSKTEHRNYVFNYDHGGQCKHLTNSNLCSIHTDSSRPKICSDFPLFIFKNYVSVADSFCPACQEGLLDDYLKQLEDLGLKKV